MILKIISLNIWNYALYQERKPKIIKFIKKQNPDVLVLQEIRDDTDFNVKGNDQAKQLNLELKYPYYEFYAVTDKQKERPEKYRRYCIEGTAIFSKFPIENVRKIELTKQPDDRYTCGNLHVTINANKKIHIIGVHFSNSNLFSLLHLIETLKYALDNKIKPIIVGDFNILHPNWLADVVSSEYLDSYNFKKYISYPSKNETLDYIVIPKEFSFVSLDCSTEELSDHRALIAEIKY